MLGDFDLKILDAITNKTHDWRRRLEEMWEFQRKWRTDPTSVTEEYVRERYPSIRTVRLQKSNLLVTYGELNTLPDYMANPTVLDEQPEDILLPILQAVRQQFFNRTGALLNKSREYFDKAIFDDSKIFGFLGSIAETQALEDLTKNIGPHGINHYKGLLARGACHFAPYSWYRWEQYHMIARSLAAAAYHERDTARRKELTYQAWLNCGYADHFLQDSFAAGHLVNKTLVMQWFIQWLYENDRGRWTRNWDSIWPMKAECRTDLPIRDRCQPDLAAWGLYDWEARGHVRDPQTVEEQEDPCARMYMCGIRKEHGFPLNDTYKEYLELLKDVTVQLSAAILHDHYNNSSLWAGSTAAKEPFQVWGDETMLNGGDGVYHAGEAAHLSQDAIRQILTTGCSDITVQNLRDRFPNHAGKDRASLQPLAQWNANLKSAAMHSLFPQVEDWASRWFGGTLGPVSVDEYLPPPECEAPDLPLSLRATARPHSAGQQPKTALLHRSHRALRVPTRRGRLIARGT